MGGRYTLIANGEPPLPVAPDVPFTCFYCDADRQFPSKDSKLIQLYHVWPIFTSERDYEKQHGVDAMMNKFRQAGVSPLVNLARTSAV